MLKTAKKTDKKIGFQKNEIGPDVKRIWRFVVQIRPPLTIIP
uniref:Uncharacterized protein n=1 Tax=virus sp. ct5rm7 TaxID=2827298 RepID=A0A8S5RGX2_9VIRU|nr:MAG TPA: hypothetical protein [virus sp. ct5rm7]